MAAEVAEQPAVLAHLLDAGRAEVAAVAEAIAHRRPRFVLLAARGTSDHAALYAKYLVEVRLGLPAGLVSPSTLTAYGVTPDLRDVLLVAVSQSGSSPDLVEWTAAARGAGALTVAVTNSAGSQLAQAAELHVDVRAGHERAVAATKTYTAELLALWLLIDRWAGGDGAAAQPVPDAVAELVGRRAETQDLAERLASDHGAQVVLTARGYASATAREGALKLMETSYLGAHAWSGADLLHGPLAVVGPSTPVVAVVPTGRAAPTMRPVLARLREMGAPVTVIGAPDAEPGRSTDLILPPGLTEELSPIAEIVPLQWAALDVALRRGVDPDAPRGLSKVTSTW
jgi:glutamine---fructose-6-phosphate transaminase (isomerizing)